MTQKLELSDVHQGFVKQADENLLDRLRELSVIDRPMSGLPDPQQAAVVAGLMELSDTDDFDTILPVIKDFIKCFRLAHDYVVTHGPLWTQAADQPDTVSAETANCEPLPSRSR